jgi:hypothetical protein
LRLNVLRLARPLFRWGRPWTSFGGGKRRLGGVNPHLGGCLENGLSQLGHQIPYLDLRAADQIAGRGIVDRIGHLLQNPPHFRLHLRHKLLLVHLHEPIHGLPPQPRQPPPVAPHHTFARKNGHAGNDFAFTKTGKGDGGSGTLCHSGLASL